MDNLVAELEKAIARLTKTVDCFPKGKRELILFDKWSLKDILVHLTGWAKYQTKTLKEIQKGKSAETLPNLKSLINEDFVDERKNLSWERVYQDFSTATQKLVNEYRRLPEKFWQKKVYQDKATTVADFIQIEINHYQKTHGPQIAKAL